MMDAVKAYLALRRATGFEMANAECLLDSFAHFAAEWKETRIRTQTAIDWAVQGPSVAQRDERLKTVCRFAVTSAPKTVVTSCRQQITSGTANGAACRTSTPRARSTASSKQPINSDPPVRCDLEPMLPCFRCWRPPDCGSPRRWPCDLPTSHLTDC
jgi:hypothetical protein